MLRRLWLHAVIFAITAVAAAALAHFLAPYVTMGPAQRLGGDAVEGVLTIIASSMLAVATFSLTTFTTAFGMVQTTATPRAAALMIEDRSAQTALSAFLGAFIFSVVALVALSTGFYGPEARSILFIETAIVLGLVVVAMLHWIDEASRLGLMSETLGRVERATLKSLRHMQKRPYLGAAPAVETPNGCVPLVTGAIGFIQHIDIHRLEAKAERLNVRVHLQMTPGDFCDGSRPLALVEPFGAAPSEEALAGMAAAFVVGEVRTFDQDPGYGLIILREIACRALSPAINDAGTAIAVIGTAVRILREWARPEPDARVTEARVLAPSIEPAELLDDVFTPIARDGAHMLEVGVRLQAAFHAVSKLPGGGFEAAARAQALMALERAGKAMAHEADIARLERAARPLLGREAAVEATPAQERALADVLP